MNKVFYTILVLVLSSSCNQYKSEHNGYFISEEPELGDRLAIEREDTSFWRFVGVDNKKRILQKGVILKYHLPDGTIDKQYSWGEGSVVGGCIVKYGVDDTFFIVEQKSLDDIFGKIKIVGNEVIRDKMPSTVNEMRVMLNKCDCSKYWIVNIKTDDIYGPFSLDEFISNRKKLGVSTQLRLNNPKN